MERSRTRSDTKRSSSFYTRVIKIYLHVVEEKLVFLTEADPAQAPAIAASDQVPATAALWPYCSAPALATVEPGWP